MPKHDASTDSLAAALLFDAVLPCVPTYLKQLPKGEVEWSEGTGSIVFTGPGGRRVVIAGDEEGDSGEPPDEGKKAVRLRLHYMTQQQAAAAYRGNAAWPPVPVSGWYRWGLIRRIARMMDGFQACLNARGEDQSRPRAQLMLELVSRAVAVLGPQDKASIEARANGPSGVMRLELEGEAKAWQLNYSDGTVTCSQVLPDDDFDARMVFCDEQTLLGVLDGRLDPGVEIGLGQIRLEGYLPLIDLTGFIMNRMEEIRHGR